MIDRTARQRLEDALTAAHDAAFAEGIAAAIDGLEVFAAHVAGDRPLTKRQGVALRTAFLAVAAKVKTAATMQRAHGQFEPALISGACGEELIGRLRKACDEALARHGVGQ